ncbi:hypothetical protein U9M48_001987 [Paspalum notatum var. saurae]|uniref:Uncharacterized protein n=1 Tax=Paspalum notatum var. saurae TaxID=547442 RepID=A0AAQ3SH42_PASNO
MRRAECLASPGFGPERVEAQARGSRPNGPTGENKAERAGRGIGAEKLTRSLIQNSEPEHQEDDPEDPEYLPEENTDEQDSSDDEPDNIVTRDDRYED